MKTPAPASPPPPTQFNHRVIRHLAWLCHSPSLIKSDLHFPLNRHLPPDWPDILATWDRAPQSGSNLLSQAPPRRLGQYFEQLYRCLLEHMLGWEVLAQNTVIRDQHRTLGELDFLVRDPATGAIEHHEIALKFYLGHRLLSDHESIRPDDSDLWYGPGVVDRLDIKVHHLLARQSRLTHLPQTQDVLQQLGIDTPVHPRVFMLGYLFYPPCPPRTPPDYVHPDHCRGQWFYADQAMLMDTRHWTALNKPDWLGPWQQKTSPDAAETRALLATIAAGAPPQLFAILARDEGNGCWREISRCFVVPSGWPTQGS